MPVVFIRMQGANRQYEHSFNIDDYDDDLNDVAINDSSDLQRRLDFKQLLSIQSILYLTCHIDMICLDVNVNVLRACDNTNAQVLLVTGGYGHNSEFLSSTEVGLSSCEIINFKCLRLQISSSNAWC